MCSKKWIQLNAVTMRAGLTWVGRIIEQGQARGWDVAVWGAEKFWKVGGGRISGAPDCPAADSVRAHRVTEDFRIASLGDTRQTSRAS